MKKNIHALLLLLLLLMAFFAAVPGFAQQHFVFRVGGGIASNYGGSTRNVGAFNIGLGYEYELDQKWSVEPSVLFFSKGWKERTQTVPARDDNGNLVYDDNGNQVFGKKGTKSYAYYVEVPLVVNYYIHLSSPHYLNLTAGPYAAIGVGGNTETYGDTDRQGAQRLYYKKKTFDIDGVHRFDVGLTMGVGYEYDRRINLSLNADLGLLNVNATGGKNYSLFFAFAYRL